MKRVAPRELPDYLVSQGRYVATLPEVEELCRVDHQGALLAVHRLKERGKVFSPVRGLYVVIPPEYRSWGVVPADWFIDPMMKHLGRPYYVGLLTAAAMHGAARQAPMVYQVMTKRRLLDRDLERVRLRFYVSARADKAATQQFPVHTGTVRVATKETTVVDLVTHLDDAGGISNVATIVAELGELRGADLAREASVHGRAVPRRVGWLVSHFGSADDLEAVRQAARLDLGEPVELHPGGRRRGSADREWAVRINVDVEPDL